MQNKVVVITGASDGIGAVAAAELHDRGATVIVVGRSPEKTKHVADEIGAKYYTADFSKLDDVRKLADDLNRDYPKIDVLINNAGGIFSEREVTVDGIEKTLQVNHIAPFLLTNLLIDGLVKNHSTIINVSSIANRLFGKVDISDMNLEHNYSANRAYGNGKLGNILFTKELHRRYHDQGLSTVAVHPGNIASNFASQAKGPFKFLYHTSISKIFLSSTKKGAEPLVWLATTQPETDWKSGEYYDKLKLGQVNKQALDDAFVSNFWNASEELIG